MDERLAALDRRIAEAADAWLTDPQDTGVYARLVDAVRSRRAYLNPTLDEAAATEPSASTMEPIAVAPAHLQPDEVLDDLSEARPVRPVLAGLGHDPQALLDRLRTGFSR